MQVKQLLEQHFPGMEVLGSTYPIPASRQMLGNVISVVQMAALIMIFAGPQIFAAMGQPEPPAWYQQVAGNKASAGIAVWFVGNMLHNSVMSSGAFEIYLNGQLVRRGAGHLQAGSCSQGSCSEGASAHCKAPCWAVC
jgi:hypothetical protein